jgi:hypothetical protein
MTPAAGAIAAPTGPSAWVRRYGPAEALALAAALAGFLAVQAATGDRAAASLAAAIADNLAYYGFLLAGEIRRRAGAPGWLQRLVSSSRALACEFGPAEALDCTIVRPACTVLATAALGPGAGVLVAKLAADLAFYAPVIGMQRLRARSRTR